MADFDFSKNSDDDRLLVLSFDNTRPMTTAQVAEILKALDSDYRRMTHRDLILARMELGSTWIWLTDVALYVGYGGAALVGTAAAAKASEELWEFAKKIGNGLKPKKNAVPGHELPPPDEGVDKSVLAILKAADQNHSTVRMRKVTAKAGVYEAIEIEVTSREAKVVRNMVKNRPKAVQPIEPFVASIPTLTENVAKTFRALPAVTAESEDVIRAIVHAHVINGGAFMLQQVAATLEAEGRWDIASIIRQHLGGHGTIQIGN